MTPQLPITPDKLAAYAGTLREKEGVRNELDTSVDNLSGSRSPSVSGNSANSSIPDQTTRKTAAGNLQAEHARPLPNRGRDRESRASTRSTNERQTSDISRTVTPTQHFPLVPEPKHSAPTYSEDARLTALGTMALFQLWQAPNNMKDIEQLAAYFSVPPTVIHRELQELELIPEEFSGEKITVEWMLKDARTQRERQREARERFLRDNEGRDVEGMYQFEEWRITTPHSSPIPINEFVLDPGHPEMRPVPDNYLAAEDEVRAQEIERVIDAGEAANAPQRARKK